MALQIKQELLQANNPNTSWNHLTPQGIVIHETADNSATAQNESDYEHEQAPHTSAHYFVDDVEIIQNIPENVVAWHAGPTANDRFLAIELCHFDGDEAKFNKVWANGVALAADICHRLQFDPSTTIHSHQWVSEEWHESDHQDPISYFAEYKKTMDNFVSDVVTAVNALKSSATPTGTHVTPSSNVNLPVGYMSKGSTGASVIELQEALNQAMSSKTKLTVDGDFGPNTDAALRAFQKAQGLAVDGIYGPATRAKLESVLA